MKQADMDQGTRTTRIEELLAHQQHLIDTLNGVVTSQQQQLDAMERKVTRLEAQVAGLDQRAAQAGEDLPHEKPPHY